MCSKFEESSDSSCGSGPSSSSSSSNDRWKITEWDDLTKLILGVGVVASFIVAVFAFHIPINDKLRLSNEDDVDDADLMSVSMSSQSDR